jgi:AcrR family transcriptional regulator
MMSPEHKTTTTRNRILTAATKLFADKGFDATGIDEIARNVGITKSVIYYHFKNKDEILGTIIQDFIEESIKIKEKQAASFLQDPKQTVKPVIDMIIAFCREHVDIFRIIMMETMKRGPDSPLFTLWDANIDIGKKVVDDTAVLDSSIFKQEWLLEAYFMLFVPVISFFVYVDDWGDHYGVDTSKTIEMFQSILTRFYTNYVVPHVFSELAKE